MTISIKPTASGSTIEQDGSTILTVDGSGNLTFPNNATFSGTVTGVSSYSDSDALSLLNASGSAPVYAARAWVNFNGTGTVAIRASGNVSSITDNGQGKYTVNFTTAMPDTSYGFAMNAQETVSSSGSDAPSVAPEFGSSLTTSSLSFNVVNAVGSSFLDCPNVSVTIFR